MCAAISDLNPSFLVFHKLTTFEFVSSSFMQSGSPLKLAKLIHSSSLLHFGLVALWVSLRTFQNVFLQFSSSFPSVFLQFFMASCFWILFYSSLKALIESKTFYLQILSVLLVFQSFHVCLFTFLEKQVKKREKTLNLWVDTHV